jgi:hypothetical protein
MTGPAINADSPDLDVARDLDVSIIVVNWNTREMTLDCLRTVFAETHTANFEVILVDNGSADGSAQAIAREFPQVRLMAETTNHGFAVANNMAAKIARGRRLLLLNTDTLVLERAIDRVVSFADSRPAAGIWGGRTLFGDRTLNYTSCWGRQTFWSVICWTFGLSMMFRRINFFNPEGMVAWLRDDVREVDIVTGCFLLIDTDLWNRLDGFDPAFFMYGEEADLCARARALGARPVITPDATIVHFGKGSAANRADPMVRLIRAKIALARRSMNSTAATAVRWLYLVAVVLRAICYGTLAPFTKKAKGPADLWRTTLARRDEWFARSSLLV